MLVLVSLSRKAVEIREVFGNIFALGVSLSSLPDARRLT